MALSANSSWKWALRAHDLKEFPAAWAALRANFARLIRLNFGTLRPDDRRSARNGEESIPLPCLNRLEVGVNKLRVLDAFSL